jgi:ParB-like chromosome segregation protein Spo0J
LPEVATVSVKDLVLIPELSPRTRLCEETVIRYMESFEALPPIRVQAHSRIVVDGYHRAEAAVRLGLEQVRVELHDIPDEELRLVAGLANVQHGQPLTRTERNRLAVALVGVYGKLREEAAQLLGISPQAVTLALREHQFNEQLSEKLGSPVQVINSSHVRALYRVGPDQRERLLEAVVSKVDDAGVPYPLSGAELKLLVDRMLDPATPAAEINRLITDPRARPKPPAPPPGAPNDEAFVSEGGGARPWEREWESPLKGGDPDAFDRLRSVDEDLDRAGAYEGRERPIHLPGERSLSEQGAVGPDPYYPGGWEPGAAPPADDRLREGVAAAVVALGEIAPRVEPPEVRAQVEAVLALLRGLA